MPIFNNTKKKEVKIMKKKVLLTAVLIFMPVLLAFIAYLFIIFLGDYVIDEKKLVMNSTSRLVDERGNEITKLYIENRDLISLKDIPEHVQQAFVAVEDRRFYEHHGLDVKSISRALFKDLLAGESIEGGSTITQQLAKNTFLTNDKTLLRKTKEAIIAINLENRYSKEKILEMYLNQVYFGHGAYGIQSAANFYFNKDASELTVAEGALLAGIPKAPSNYSPVANMKKSKERRDTVLSLMGKQAYLSAEDVVRAQGKTINLNIKENEKNQWLTTYIDMVFDEAKQKYSLSNEELMRGGYTITVPLNESVQKAAYELFEEGDYFPGKDDNVEGAFILLDNKTGGVAAAIGGRNYVPKGLNRLYIARQPGSTFKPIAVYAPLMEEGKYEPYSLLEDMAFDYNGYTPRNYDGKYAGKITMFDAIIHSKNASAVWALNELSINKSKEYLKKAGMNIDDKGLAIALGGLEKGVTPIQLANAYRTFAENGLYSDQYVIKKIVDRENKVIARIEKEERQVYSRQTAWNMTRMLEHVVTEGTAKAGKYSGELAGKTGSTSYPNVKGATKDAWFVGYTSEVTGAVWIGYDRTDKDHYLTKGSSYPTKLFKDILSKADMDKDLAFNVPKGVKDLDEPIRLRDISEFDAAYTFKPFGLFTIMLKWETQQDPRVVYRIYEKDSEEKRLVGTVTGEGAYEIPYVNVFSDAAYQIVPFNVQTKEEGKGTKLVKPTLYSKS